MTQFLCLKFSSLKSFSILYGSISQDLNQFLLNSFLVERGTWCLGSQRISNLGPSHPGKGRSRPCLSLNHKLVHLLRPTLLLSNLPSENCPDKFAAPVWESLGQLLSCLNFPKAPCKAKSVFKAVQLTSDTSVSGFKS